MTPIKKLSSWYAVTMLVTLAAIMGVLHVGSALTPPGAVTSGKTPVMAAPAESALAGLTTGLRAHLDNPLGHLLVQLFAVIALAQLAGHLFRRIGQPAVVGEIVVGILLGP